MRVPHRDDPRDPWTDEDIGPLYMPRHAEAPYLEVDVDDAVEWSGLLGPDGEEIPPPDPIPFGFQPSAKEVD